jgi:phosphoesterase RecJ-like protein
MKIANINTVQALIAEPKKISIVPHRNPDGDALGSSLGLYYFLKKLGHEVHIIVPNDFPDFLRWMPGSEKIKIFEREQLSCKNILLKSDLIFALDFNALHRTGEIMSSFLTTLKSSFLMIDHHQSPEDFAVFTYSDTEISSTCEMIYHFIIALEKQDLIDETIGTCLYTGIVTDTGSFKFNRTTKETHEAVAFLISKGIDNTKIHNQLFDTQSYNRLQLLGKALNNLKVFPEFKTAYTTLSQEELDEFHYKKGDTEGFVNYGLSIEGVQFAVIFIENKEEGIIKMSLRSLGNFDVNEIARRFFNGGGHVNAAGGKSDLTLTETTAYFESILPSLNLQTFIN